MSVAEWPPESGGGSGTVTDVTATSPIASSGGTTPNISLTGVVDTAHGGTGLSAPSTSGNVLTSNGTIWTSVAPAAGGVTTVGAFSGSAQTNGASISSTTITFGPASATVPGMVSTAAQTWAGVKTHNDNVIFAVGKGIQLGASSNVIVDDNADGNPDQISYYTTTGHRFYANPSGTDLKMQITSQNLITYQSIRAVGTINIGSLGDGTPTPFAIGYITKIVSAGTYVTSPLEFDNGNSGTSKTIDWSTGSSQRIKWTGNCTVTLSNPVVGGAYVIKVVNDGTVRTITWPAAVHWSGGVAPTFTGTNLQVDLINFYWDGTSYFGTYSLNYAP